MKKIKKEIKHGVPDWLVKLPKGKYTIDEIATITKQSYSNVYMRFRLLDIKSVKSKRFNYVLNFYKWKGASYYLKKILKQKING